MNNGIADMNEVKEISAGLTRENKKHVIAVARELVFSQRNQSLRCHQSGQIIKSQGCKELAVNNL